MSDGHQVDISVGFFREIYIVFFSQSETK